ncbi:MAG TPA: valine--tRNA ligase [Dehalococcoidia bacterium]|nr:valine--tRNA ligase [Dehalococcoidia bacterium]
MAQAPEIQNEMPKAYEPGNNEQKWYDFWMQKGYFRAERDPEKKPFAIILPLPNVTGELHIGHVLVVTLQDIMTRWHRMKGDSALWLPGTDHAGIATQVVMERVLAGEGTTRQQLGREKFIERTHEWVRQVQATIANQHHRLGASCDWSREYFTLDEQRSKAVRTTFVNLYNKGLIYKGERIVNWCPKCSTALSDLEVDHSDVTGKLWYVRYPIVGEDGYITVATTRPETILGDTAVAVNPYDERYKDLVGKKVLLPAVNRQIEIVADEAVDPVFGTGAVKITPAHDPVDFEVAQRNNLEFINILNDDATMNANAGPYEGMDRYECREAIVADLEKSGQLVKIEPYSHAVGHCHRCQTSVEPIVSEQWWVRVQPLAEPAIEAVKDGHITIVPSSSTKVYLNWMENIRDWCISRQLWWGHQVPVWYCGDCNQLTVKIETPDKCEHCGSTNIKQDPDVLDTLFSSALVTHSTLGWPDYTDDLRYFYPTTVMETAYDILFFWVARMIMMGLENMGDIPFSTVYLHGLIRDERGMKMSKVRGNVVNPIEKLEQYGTDALRFAVITGTSPATDSKLGSVKLEAGRNFANKLWNATRYVLRNIPEGDVDIEIQYDSLPVEDRWILSRLNRIVASVNKFLEGFQFAEAQRYMHEFLWSEYCDWYIELAKTRLNSEEEGTVSPVPVLVHVLEASLRMLHPYMPFITEELWQHLKWRLPEGWQEEESIMISAYPEADERLYDDEAERIMESVTEIVRSIRNARSQYNVDNSKWIEAQVYGGVLTDAIKPYSGVMETLARAKPVTILDDRSQLKTGEKALAMVLKEVEVVIPMESMVDVEVEKQRLQKEIERDQAEFDRLEIRLKDKAFLEKAPAAVVEKERQKKDTIADKIERLKQQLLNY